MAIPNYLQAFKASGIYRVEFDKSEVTNELEPQQVRLVAGFSETGPFNTPVYVKTVAEFKSVFGDVSAKLEARGCFFHRTVIDALAYSPVICLNLHDISGSYAGIDVVNSYSAHSVKRAATAVYNKSRFWKVDEEKLGGSNPLRIVSVAPEGDKKTVVVVPAAVTGYDASVRVWYNVTLATELPDYLSEVADVNVRDTFVDVYVFDGDIKAVPELSKYFDANGNIKGYVLDARGNTQRALDAIADSPYSSFVARYTGSLIPQFKDANGNYAAIDLLINQDSAVTSLYAHIQMPSGVCNYDDIISNALTEDGANKYAYNAGVEGRAKNSALGFAHELHFVGDNVVADAYDALFAGISAIKSGDDTMLVNKDAILYTPIPDKEVNLFAWASYNGVPNAVFEKAKDNALLQDGDTLYTIANNIAQVKSVYNSGDMVDDDDYMANKHGYVAIPVSSTEYVVANPGLDAQQALQGNNEVKIYFLGSDGNYEADPVTVNNSGNSTNIVYIEDSLFLDAVLGADSLSKGSIYAGISGGFVKYDGNNANDMKQRASDGAYYELIANPAAVYPAAIANLLVSEASIRIAPSTADRECAAYINEYLNLLVDKDSGIYTAMTDGTEVEYRYLVDSFQAYPEQGVHYQLFTVCQGYQRALALANFISMKTASGAEYPGLQTNGEPDVAKIVKSTKYSVGTGGLELASEADGASWGAYFTPLSLSDGYITKVVPSAGLVSNEFMKKWADRQPFSPVAGVQYGNISREDIRPEYAFSKAELNLLEPYGVNAILWSRTYGTYVNSNQTAKQKIVTALSKINVRELVIYLQDEIMRMLQQYHWNMNTPELRATVQDRADAICELIKNNGGLYDYKNTCDGTNNTPEIIDNEMLILDTAIEPARAAGKMVHRLTIYKTGQISSLGLK